MIKKLFIHTLCFFLIDYYYYHYLRCLKVVTIGAELPKYQGRQTYTYIRTTNQIRNHYHLDEENERKSFWMILHSTSHAHYIYSCLITVPETFKHYIITYYMHWTLNRIDKIWNVKLNLVHSYPQNIESIPNVCQI